MDMIRVPFEELIEAMARRLVAAGMDAPRANLSATLIAQTDRDGVYSHGVRRFPTMLKAIAGGQIDVTACPVRAGGGGALEQWDGRRGVGNLAAWASMGRAIELARAGGIGCVGLRNTNHWLRAGTYGWQAADAGCIGICWTNTEPNMPPWGSGQMRVGNNPLVIAVPRAAGHVVVDMALSQFSWGKIFLHAGEGKPLPVAGGSDQAGQLTTDAAAIQATHRSLPTGFWKGSALSIVLDMAAAMIAGGSATWQLEDAAATQAGTLGVSGPSARRTGPSQVFIAVDAAKLAPPSQREALADGIVHYVLASPPAGEGQAVLYPGQRVLQTRAENLAAGVPVPARTWAQVRPA